MTLQEALRAVALKVLGEIFGGLAFLLLASSLIIAYGGSV